MSKDVIADKRFGECFEPITGYIANVLSAVEHSVSSDLIKYSEKDMLGKYFTKYIPIDEQLFANKMIPRLLVFVKKGDRDGTFVVQLEMQIKKKLPLFLFKSCRDFSKLSENISTLFNYKCRGWVRVYNFTQTEFRECTFKIQLTAQCAYWDPRFYAGGEDPIPDNVIKLRP